ncbi:hypothetical protein HDC90_000093 [Pedobacter sp. AK013]|uniref:glycosyl transferase n=1 Tax=Pedobacter sp. AK013 TaxID=2723071 RepID=UPI00161AC6DB|nr:glycosyl transferase [Pedobacter sp. AK013]MBB6235496.1 hypothetical protein [Pedobacter sp. AK013]
MFQKLVNHLYRYPKSNWKTIQRFGGYLSYWRMLASKKQMQKASENLPPIISNHNGFPIYFLTGKKYLYQTLFCALSLTKSCKETFRFILIDDGSFDQDLINQVKQQMPNVKLILKNEIENNLELKLPTSAYPFLHQKRKIYPHIKKLTDIHTIDDNPFKLVLDSDMLFWNEPTELIDWLKNPNGCIYMLDSEESYGYDKALMETLCGFTIPNLMNVGTFGVNSNSINWNNIENWAKSLEEKQGASYFLEQALSVMVVANQKKTILNKEEYIVNPHERGSTFNRSKLHHYVDLSKRHYFENDWKAFL